MDWENNTDNTYVDGDLVSIPDDVEGLTRLRDTVDLLVRLKADNFSLSDGDVKFLDTVVPDWRYDPVFDNAYLTVHNKFLV